MVFSRFRTMICTDPELQQFAMQQRISFRKVPNLREGLHGGRCEVFRAFYDTTDTTDLIEDLDVNSLYPDILLTEEFMFGQPEIYDRKLVLDFYST